MATYYTSQGDAIPSRYGERIKHALAEYNERYSDATPEGSFYVSDYYQLRDIAGADPVTMVFRALEAGFMIGYRKGKRDARRKAKSA